MTRDGARMMAMMAEIEAAKATIIAMQIHDKFVDQLKADNGHIRVIGEIESIPLGPVQAGKKHTSEEYRVQARYVQSTAQAMSNLAHNGDF